MVARLLGADQTHALIVGINDYGGDDDLKGGVPDARAWVHIALEMGIPGDNITVLSRPQLDASHWPDDEQAARIRFGDATYTSLLEASKALAGSMDRTQQSKALVTFSGHGSWDHDEHAMLVPADGLDAPARRVPLDEVLDILDSRAPQTDITLFIDACHAGRDAAERRARSRTVAGDAVPPDARLCTMRRGGDIVITASQPQTLSHEIEVGGEYRGAFSWAITSLLDRWGVRSAGIDPDFDISYADLLDRANQLLMAMEVTQPPQYNGPQWALERAVLSSRLADEPDGVPDDEGGVREVDPIIGWYQIEATGGIIAGGVTFSSGEMDWTWDLDEVTGPFPSGLSLTLTQQSGTFTPPKNKLVQGFQNHNGLKKGSETIAPTYQVTGSGSSHTYYVRYSSTSGLNWVADTASNVSGTTLTFTAWTGGNVTGSHARHDGFV